MGRKSESRAVIRVSPRIGGGARHAECCVFAYDDLVNLLGLHLLGLLYGILERRSPSGAEHGRAVDARERNGFDAGACRSVAECKDGVLICWSRAFCAMPDRLGAVELKKGS